VSDVLRRLAGGDRRSIGRANDVAAEVLRRPELFPQVFDGMFDADPMIRMRAADVVEKVTARHPEWLRPYKSVLLHRLAEDTQQEVRWHVAQMLPRLDLCSEERARSVGVLIAYLDDRSKIVQVNAMQALADLARRDPCLAQEVCQVLSSKASSASPAVRARAKKLLRRQICREAAGDRGDAQE